MNVNDSKGVGCILVIGGVSYLWMFIDCLIYWQHVTLCFKEHTILLGLFFFSWFVCDCISYSFCSSSIFTMFIGTVY
jgi:hypothetical protein